MATSPADFKEPEELSHSEPHAVLAW